MAWQMSGKSLQHDGQVQIPALPLFQMCYLAQGYLTSQHLSPSFANGEQQCLPVGVIVSNKSIRIFQVNRLKQTQDKQPINDNCNDRHPICYCARCAAQARSQFPSPLPAWLRSHTDATAENALCTHTLRRMTGEDFLSTRTLISTVDGESH